MRHPAVLFHGRWESGKRQRQLGRHKNPGLELVLARQGELHWQVEGREETVRSGMLFYTLPWEEHGGVEPEQPSSEIAWMCLPLDGSPERPRRTFQFHPSLALTRAESTIISRALTASPRRALPASEAFIAAMEAWFDEANVTGRVLQRTRQRDLLRLLLVELTRCVLAATAAGPSAHPPNPEVERRLSVLIRQLQSDPARPWTLAEMSRACRLGRTQFAAALKRRTGDTPILFLNRLRLQRAKHLLVGTRRTVTEIAIEVGFNSSQYFATVFKEFTGLEPSAYRQLHGKK